MPSTSELSRAFLAALPRPMTAPDDLDARLQALYDAGRAAWPKVLPTPEAYGRHLATRVPADKGLAEGLDSLVTTDLYLACACASADRRAIDAFDAAYLSKVPLYIASLRAPDSFADELRQVLREKLFVQKESEPAILQYTGRGAISGWLRVVAMRTAVSLRRGKINESEPLDDSDPLPAGADPELDYLRARTGNEFGAALREAMGSLSDQERNVMRFYFVDRLTVEQIGGLYKVNKSTVSRWITRGQERILERTREILSEKLRLSESEMHSAFRAIQSNLDMSIASLLKTR